MMEQQRPSSKPRDARSHLVHQALEPSAHLSYTVPMRRIARPSRAPYILSSPQFRDARAELFRFLRRPVDERRQRRAPLAEDMFYESELLHDIADVFKNKCAYCETIVRSPVVRHFRPLQYAEPTNGIDTTHYYAWLAFEWQNMLLGCDVCEKAKASLFPMAKGGRSTYLARYGDLREQEYALLLDPCSDDPRRHLQFLSDGSCLHRTARGAGTIQIIGLNRFELIRSRRDAMVPWLDMLTQNQKEFVRTLRDPTYRSPFALSAEHIGASLSVLKAILVEWRGTSERDITVVASFLRNVSDEIRNASERDRRGLSRLVEDLRASDDNRGPALRAAIPKAESQSDVMEMDSRRRIVLEAHDREIARITVSNVKAIDHLEIQMAPRRSGAAGVPCLAILGENSTGKSTLLSAIALALIGAKQSRGLKLGPSHLLSSSGIDRLDLLDADPATVEIDFHYLDGHARFSLDPETERIDGQSEQMAVVLAYGPRRYFSPRHRNRPEGARHRVKTLFD